MNGERTKQTALATKEAANVAKADEKARAVAEARTRRKWMATKAGFNLLADGLEASMEPRDAIEEMLLDQLAQSYNAAIRMMGVASVAKTADEAVRLTNASARLMEVFQQGALTLHRLRTGGKQVVTVQHVTVGQGGQAVVAQIAPGASGPGAGEEPEQ